MDPLSITASLIAVIQITTVVSSHCMQYVRSAKNTKSLILSLVQELGGLQIVLTTLRDLTDRDYCEPGDTDAESIDKTYLLPTLRKLVELEHVFKECLDKLEGLKRDIAPSTERHLSKKETFFRALNWPIKEAYTKNIMRDISEYISLFSLALTLDETTNVLEIREKTFETNSMVKSLHAQRDEDLKRQHGSEIVQWLSAPDASVDYMHALKRKTLNTGTWLIEEQQYKEWRLHPGSLLCIYGTAGSGKTILSSTIVEDVLSYSASTMNLAAAYFYFKADDIARRTSEGMLRSLLKQLFDRGNRSSEALMRLFEDRNQRPPVSKLLSTFVDITFEFGNVFIVLDALDECQDLSDLFDMIEEINIRAGTNVHILFTSRETKDIREFVDSMETNTKSIKLSASVVKQDIRTYIRDRLRTDRALKRWRSHPKVQEQIEDSLIEKSDGMFQWVKCQLEELTNCRGPADLRQALARMPKGLNDTYAQMISRISDDDHEVAMRMLYWLLFSFRPLQIEELAELVAMDLTSDSFETIEHLWDPNDVLDICPGLMTTIEERGVASEEEPKILVRLAHISIRDYLLSSHILNGKVAQFHVEESAAHTSITECCLKYMRLAKGPFPDAFDGLPLGVYVAENWLYHYERTPDTATGIHNLCLDFFLNRKELYMNWITYYSSLSSPRFSGSMIDTIPLSPLNVASAYGLLPVIKLLLDSDEVDTKTGKLLQNALYAAYVGVGPWKEDVKTKTVRLLLQHGADFSGGKRFLYNLHAASFFGFDDVVVRELDDGFDVNTRGGHFGTALQAAVSGRYDRNSHAITKTKWDEMRGNFDGISLETVRILLQRGADPNICDGDLGSALYISCLNGDLSCAKLLLDSAADPNYKLKKENDLFSCVYAATRSGDIRLLQLLFDHGARMDCAFALNATALVKDINIIRLLLDKGADPNAVTEDDDETPLQRICTFCPAPEAVELLLKYGADPNLGGGRFGSPLQSTCQAYGSVETLKVLIKYGANVNQSCGGFGTALHAAAFYGDFEMVQYLVAQGADIHAKGHMYPSVVRCAMQNGHGQILVFLLKLGADMDTHGGRYGDTLQKLLATAPADEPELWFRTYAKANSVQMFVMIKKGATWQDFDDIVFYDRSVDGEHVDDSKWACILPPAVLTPIRPVRY